MSLVCEKDRKKKERKLENFEMFEANSEGVWESRVSEIVRVSVDVSVNVSVNVPQNIKEVLQKKHSLSHSHMQTIAFSPQRWTHKHMRQ